MSAWSVRSVWPVVEFAACASLFQRVCEYGSSDRARSVCDVTIGSGHRCLWYPESVRLSYRRVRVELTLVGYIVPGM